MSILDTRVGLLWSSTKLFHRSPNLGCGYMYETRWLYCVECRQYSIRLEMLLSVRLPYNVFFKLNDLHISTSVPTTRTTVSPYLYVQSEKEHWNSCWHGCCRHHCIAKVPMTHNAAIRAVARAGEGKDRSFNKITGNWVMTQFAVHPVEGSFGNEFPSICSHCRVMATCSCKTWKESANF